MEGRYFNMSKKKFFIKEEEGIYSVDRSFFNDIETRQEALGIALRTLGEIHNTMYEEVETGIQYIGSIKVIIGLQRCINELNIKWPGLISEIYSVQRKINGKLLGCS